MLCFYYSLILLNRITEYIQNHYQRGDLCYTIILSTVVQWYSCCTPVDVLFYHLLNFGTEKTGERPVLKRSHPVMVHPTSWSWFLYATVKQTNGQECILHFVHFSWGCLDLQAVRSQWMRASKIQSVNLRQCSQSRHSGFYDGFSVLLSYWIHMWGIWQIFLHTLNKMICLWLCFFMSKAFDMNIITSVSIWLTSPKVFKVNELAASVANAKSQRFK